MAQPAAPIAQTATTHKVFLSQGRTLPPSSGIVESTGTPMLESRRLKETEERRLEPGKPTSLGLRPSNGCSGLSVSLCVWSAVRVRRDLTCL